MKKNDTGQGKRNHHIKPLWLVLRFPYLSLNAIGKAYNESSPCVIEENKKIVSLTDNLVLSGLSIGENSLKATLLHNAELIKRDREKEQAFIALVEHQAYSVSPHFLWLANHSIAIEISSSLCLFGGCENLVAHIVNSINSESKVLFGVSFTSIISLSRTYQSAHIFSFIKNTISSVDEKNLYPANYRFDGEWDIELLKNMYKKISLWRSLLNNIPIKLIETSEVFHKEVNSLLKMGFYTLSDITRYSAKDIKDRYSEKFYHHINDMFAGHAFSNKNAHSKSEEYTYKHAISMRPLVMPSEIFFESVEFEYPVTSIALLHQAFEDGLKKLKNYLIKYQLECTELVWGLKSITKQLQKENVSITALHSDWYGAYEITCLYFENITLPFEVDSLQLEIGAIVDKSHEVDDLFDSVFDMPDLVPHSVKQSAAGDTKNISYKADKKPTVKLTQKERKRYTIFYNKISTKIGENACYKLSYSDTHVPENTLRKSSVLNSTISTLPICQSIKNRPPWLYIQPKSINPYGASLYFKGPMGLISRPERIQFEWRDEPVWRDYYIAKKTTGERFWVYQDIYNKKWFVHGAF